MSTPQQVLNKYFGYPSFRSGQKKIIDSILTKKDTLALMPTGAGKSICFQIPGLIMPGLTLVISPLISLMADQVKQLKKRKIKAVFINSSLSKKELSARLRRIRKNYYQFIYLAPERLTSSSWQAISPDLKISLVAVDEAHCASMWGHDFRPSYQQIAAYLKTLNQRPVVAAFTATATLQVRADICKMLALRSPKIVVQDFLRTNLNLNILLVKSRAQKVAVLYKILKNHCGQAGIVYCAARQTCQTLSTLINYHNFNEILTDTSCSYYHGAMTSKQRQIVQNQFINNQIKLICATNAFGMGVDKPDIRFVVHYQLPACLENYYQEVGRAGRDRQNSDCYLLFHQPDIKIQLGLINNQNNQSIQQLKINKFKKMIEFALEPGCLGQKISVYFEQTPKSACHSCSFCLSDKLGLDLSEKKLLARLTKQPIIPWQTKYLAAILQPLEKEQWLKLPGIGTGLSKKLDFYT